MSGWEHGLMMRINFTQNPAFLGEVQVPLCSGMGFQAFFVLLLENKA